MEQQKKEAEYIKLKVQVIEPKDIGNGKIKYIAVSEGGLNFDCWDELEVGKEYEGKLKPAPDPKYNPTLYLKKKGRQTYQRNLPFEARGKALEAAAIICGKLADQGREVTSKNVIATAKIFEAYLLGNEKGGGQ